MKKFFKRFFVKLVKGMERANQARVERYIMTKYPTSAGDVDHWMKEYFRTPH